MHVFFSFLFSFQWEEFIYTLEAVQLTKFLIILDFTYHNTFGKFRILNFQKYKILVISPTCSMSFCTFLRFPSIQALCKGVSPFSFLWKSIKQVLKNTRTNENVCGQNYIKITSTQYFIINEFLPSLCRIYPETMNQRLCVHK